MICRFSCQACGVVKEEFEVRWRGRDEDLIAWMEGVVGPAMGAAHLRVSPLCMSPNADLWMPVEEGDTGIGQRTLN